jgi:PAS domain S-box-containing protein
MSAGPLSVLIIDDNRYAYLLAHDLLEDLPWDPLNVEWAATFDEGLAIASEHRHDVYLVDYRLGEKNGVEIIRAVVNAGCMAPMILLTGEGVREVDLEAMEAGAADFLPKDNLDADLLERSIRYALRQAQTLQRLRASEERYELAVSGANDGVWDWDIDANQVFLSKRWKSILNYEEDELGSGVDAWLDLIHVADRERIQRSLDDHLAGRTQHFECECRMVAKDSQILWMLHRGTAYRDGSGRASRMAGTLTDITERRRIKADRDRLALAVTQAIEAIMITDPNNSIKYVNPAFEEMTGYSAQEIIGRNAEVLNSEKQDEKFLKHLWESLANGYPWRGRMVNRKRDGSSFEAEQTISPIRDANGRISEYVYVAHDVTREVHLQAQLRQAQKMEGLGRLAGGVAHDFNNLLTSILGFAELIREDVEGQEELFANVCEIISAGNRAAKFTRQLLNFGRRQAPDVKPFDPVLIVRSMENMLQSTIGEDIDLNFDLSDGVGAMMGDTGTFEQVVMNLVVNARDAMKTGGVLTVALHACYLDEEFCSDRVGQEPGRYVVLTVRDTGCGMPEEVKECIFEPFYTTKDISKGSGLGLATVYGIVQQFKGWIEVDSAAGEGTEFRIYVPESYAEPEPTDILDFSTPGGSETILLVEDEPGVRRLATQILKGLGYNIIQAEDGEKGFEIGKSYDGRIDLVLSDVIMPNRCGPDMVEELRKVRDDFRVLYMTGFASDRIAEAGLRGKENPVIMKPYSRCGIAQRIRTVLDEVDEPVSAVQELQQQCPSTS